MPLLQPIQTHQFRVLFGEDYQVLTDNMVSIKVDFYSRSIDIEIRDTIDNATSKAMNRFIRESDIMMWEVLDRGNNQTALRSYLFSSLELNEYRLEQDYSKAECVIMKVSFRYGECDTDYVQ